MISYLEIAEYFITDRLFGYAVACILIVIK